MHAAGSTIGSSSPRRCQADESSRVKYCRSRRREITDTYAALRGSNYAVPLCLPTIGAIACSVAMPAARAAAQLIELQPGARVRVRAPGVVAGRLEAVVIARSGDTVTLTTPRGAPIPVPLGAITAAEVSRGRRVRVGAVRERSHSGRVGRRQPHHGRDVGRRDRCDGRGRALGAPNDSCARRCPVGPRPVDARAGDLVLDGGRDDRAEWGLVGLPTARASIRMDRALGVPSAEHAAK